MTDLTELIHHQNLVLIDDNGSVYRVYPEGMRVDDIGFHQFDPHLKGVKLQATLECRLKPIPEAEQIKLREQTRARITALEAENELLRESIKILLMGKEPS